MTLVRACTLPVSAVRRASRAARAALASCRDPATAARSMATTVSLAVRRSVAAASARAGAPSVQLRFADAAVADAESATMTENSVADWRRCCAAASRRGRPAAQDLRTFAAKAFRPSDSIAPALA